MLMPLSRKNIKFYALENI